ncbi:hypothetical protein MBOU_49870 [Mycobacterium bourgelatii]|uniref:Uncharacterized protein n=1 Tax=Mycobacterium bourgelatii TaxID=1273442 RepID=A0A7I9YWD1_MYCBU|nr:hypothetical protein MBOU_49870 [Mycobacterium bourgelatii]
MPSGICKLNQVGTDGGSSRVDIDIRTFGTGVVAATAVAATAADAEPHRRPAQSRGGQNPSGARVPATSRAPTPACSGVRQDVGKRGLKKLQPTKPAANAKARTRLTRRSAAAPPPTSRAAPPTTP